MSNAPPQREARSKRRIALKIALIYGLAGILWIMTTDRLLPDYQTVKGLLYIVVTATLVYFLVRHDVNALRQSGRALAESEARKSAMLEASLDAIISLDHQGRIVEWNPSAERMFGHARDQAIGAEMAQLIIPQHLRDAQRRALADSSIAGETPFLGQHIEIPALRADGSELSVEMAVTRIAIAGPPTFIAFIRDVTGRKQAERERIELLHREQKARAQAEAASRAKDHFMAMVSHELRTPLTPVLAAVGLLKRQSTPPEEALALLDMIQRNIELEARLVSDLLDLSRFAQGKLRLQAEWIDAHRLAGDVVALFRNDLNARRQRLSLELHAADHHLLADPGRFQQMLWNLLCNAVKFTPDGGEIAVRSANANGSLVFEVADSGIGIEPEVMQRLFQPFEQGEQTLTRRYGGLGLGLNITRVLAEMHGGSVRAASDGKDRGATFTLALPIAAPPKPSPPANDAHHPSTEPARILVVEDNEDTLRLLARLLRSMGHHVQTAGSAEAAIRCASDESFDLLISDIGLPDATGWELMRQLRARRPIKGIALSGFSAPEDIQKSRNVGFVDHLTKPINIQALEQTIHRLVATSGG